MTAAEAKALLLAYLEIHNDEISEPEFTDWLDTISTPLERATVRELIIRTAGDLRLCSYRRFGRQ